MATPAIIGRYEVLERLGEGGMGAVYLARDPSIGRQIAIKVLHAHIADASLRQRFVQEARSAGSLTHPNIVTIHDFGEMDGAPYIVMEHVRGANLATVIRRRDDVRLATKLEWLEALCAGLHYAHESRIIHRDVKPQNLMVDERGTLKILDFGIARVAESGLTKVSVVIGTPGYMSPEQIEGHAIDRRSDIFSTGAVAYALIAYREAFAGDTVATVMHRVLTVHPPSLAEICTGLPTAVAAIVDRALEKDPADRFQDVVEMRRALAEAREALPRGGPEPLAAPPVGPDQERRTPAARTPAHLRKRRDEQLQRLVRDAREAIARGDLAAAAAAADAALIIDPDHREAQRLLSQAQEPQTVETEVIGSTEPGPAPVPAPPAPAVSPDPLPQRPRPIPPVPPSMRGSTAESTARPNRGPRAVKIVAAAAVFVAAAAGVWTLTRPATVATVPGPVPVAAEPRPAPVESPPLKAQTPGPADSPPPARPQAPTAQSPAGGPAATGVDSERRSADPPSPTPAASAVLPSRAAGPGAENRVRANGLVRRATAKYEAGDYDGAIQDLNRALEAVPTHDRAARLLKSVLRARETEAKMPRRRPPP